VMAMTDRAAAAHGISAFILEKGTPGFHPGKKENKLGMRCSPTSEMILADCRVPPSQLCGKLGEGFVDALRILDGGRISIAGDIDVTSFTIPHDAADPVGFSFKAEGIKVSIATDLGYMPDSVRFHLRDSDILLLESNHDLEMLKVGPYPWSIKQRIMGRMGHLSNDVACAFVRDDLDCRTSTLILGHLSAQNNHPAIVEQCARQALEGRGLFTKLVIALPNQPTGSFVY
jgi:phosphoribosyl 1,2-cyclic phosphodiesterase